MKLRNKIAAITTAAMLAFAGAGFAAWTFTTSTSDSVAVDAQVTAAIEASGLKVTSDGSTEISSLYLICDAPSGQDGLVAGNGIYWSTANENDVDKKITSLTLVGSVNEADHNIADINTYTGKFTSDAVSAVTGTYVNIAAAAALDASVTSESASADVTYEWTLPTVSYATVPTSVAQVTALQEEVADLSLIFAFEFSVVSVA